MFRATLLGGLVLGCLAVATADEAKPAHGAVTPTEKLGVDVWKKRHDRLVARAKEGGVDVLFLGDSITRQWEDAGKEAWKAAFEPLKAANFGIGGDQTGHVLWRVTAGKELDGISPKVAVLLIGTNNTADHSAEQIAEGVEAIVKELRGQRPKMRVLLLGVFPRAAKRPEKGVAVVKAMDLHPKVKQVNDRLAKLDDGKAVKYLDIGAKLLDKDGNLRGEVMPDFLHLSAKGYGIWADAIKDEVKKLLGE